ncbi:hypothetical protein Unana1_01124 [Umbelopsis nana]
MSGPSDRYLTLCQQPSLLLSKPTRPLIVLDLHGTLCSVEREPTTRRTTGCYIRPNFQKLFEYLRKHYEIAIWSSGRPESVDFLSRMFDPHGHLIKLTWTRRNFQLTKEDYQENVLTIKDLERLWAHITNTKVYHPSAYNATNTILLDDSFKKCTFQPHNCVILRTFEANDKMFKAYGDNEIDFLIPYLERARHQSNIANWMRHNPYVSVHPAETTALNSFDAVFFASDKPVPAASAQSASSSRNKRKHTSPPSSETDMVTAVERIIADVKITKNSGTVSLPETEQDSDSSVHEVDKHAFPIIPPQENPATTVTRTTTLKPQTAEYESLLQQVFSYPISLSQDKSTIV